MKKFFLLTSFVLLAIGSIQAQKFSDSTEVSLITCSPGKEVYARFGHTAIRVKDPVNDIDIVFNYGIFDFNTDNFYAKFIKGATDYLLAVYDFKYFLPDYIERNSTVWEQKLNFTQAEKEEIINALFINLRPENKTYRYNFIFDNCATRPRDKILEAFNDSNRVEFKLQEEPLTFREWVEVYVGTNTWLKFGIDMIFGAESDQLASRKESMFLPEVLMKELQAATVVSNTGDETRPAVSDTHILVQKRPEETKETFLLFRPFPVCTFFLLLGLLACFNSKKFHYLYKTFDSILYIATGLIGCIIFYLMFISIHPVVGENYNILWLSPLFLIVGIIQWIKPMRLITFCLQCVNLVFILTAFIIFASSKQALNVAFIPYILLLMARTLNYINTRLKKGIKIYGEKQIKISSK